jgi:tripartite-type tricarboxylate transporter receptor subunit TctC
MYFVPAGVNGWLRASLLGTLREWSIRRTTRRLRSERESFRRTEIQSRRRGPALSGVRALRVQAKRGVRTMSRATNRRGLRITNALAAVLVCCGTALAIAAVSGAAVRPAKSLTPLQKGMAFYRGKSMTFISPSQPGGTMDEAARFVAPAMGNYLHANVVVEDIGAAQTIPGQDQLAHSTADGLTIGEWNSPAEVVDSLTNVPSVNFNLQHEIFIGSAGGAGDTVWIAKKGSTIGSLSDMMSKPYTFCGTGQGATDIEMRSMAEMYNEQATFITDYGTTALVAAGFVRGDCNMMLGAMSTVGPLIAGGAAVPIVQTAVPRAGILDRNYVASAPTFKQLFQQHPVKGTTQKKVLAALQSFLTVNSGTLIGAPTGVSADKVLALRAALQAAMANPSVQSTMLTEGFTPGYTNGAVAKANYLDIEKLGHDLLPALQYQ